MSTIKGRFIILVSYMSVISSLAINDWRYGFISMVSISLVAEFFNGVDE